MAAVEAEEQPAVTAVNSDEEASLGPPPSTPAAAAPVPTESANPREPSTPVASFAEPPSSSERAGWLLPAIAPYVTIAYLGCVLFMMLSLVKGVWGGRRLRMSAIPIGDREFLTRIGEHAKRVGLRWGPAIAYCGEISVPVVVGILRPMVLLPASLASALSPDQLEALIMHELAHLRRYDPLMNLLQRVAVALLFFHPAVLVRQPSTQQRTGKTRRTTSCWRRAGTEFAMPMRWFAWRNCHCCSERGSRFHTLFWPPREGAPPSSSGV